MIHGLQITLTGEELRGLLAERLPAESYTLGKSDLRLAEIVAAEPNGDFEIAPDTVVGLRIHSRGATIEGLKVTLPGEEMCSVLAERIQQHRSRAEHWTREQHRTPEEQTEEDPLLPEHMCENEAARCTWRADALEFIREHVDQSAVYLLSAADLAWGELLPPKPGSLEQEEYEERTGVVFHLERLNKRIGELRL